MKAKRNDIIVDFMHFYTNEYEKNMNDIVNWINSNGGKASHDATGILIFQDGKTLKASCNEVIIKNENIFVIMDWNQFIEEYKVISENEKELDAEYLKQNLGNFKIINAEIRNADKGVYDKDDKLIEKRKFQVVKLYTEKEIPENFKVENIALLTGLEQNVITLSFENFDYEVVQWGEPKALPCDLVYETKEFIDLTKNEMEKLDKIFTTALRNAEQEDFGDDELKDMVLKGIGAWYQQHKGEIEKKAIDIINLKNEYSIYNYPYRFGYSHCNCSFQNVMETLTP